MIRVASKNRIEVFGSNTTWCDAAYMIPRLT